jgi:hypothetical protein
MVHIDESISVNETTLTLGETSINCFNVHSIKYGYAPIQLDMYTIGSRYTIDLKTNDQQLLLSFKSYFGIKKHRQYRKFASLLDSIWDSTVTRLTDEMFAHCQANKPFNIGNCIISPDGITYKNFLITWNDLTYQANYNKLTLNSKSNDKVWTNLYYLETYNIHPLRYFLDRKFQS